MVFINESLNSDLINGLNGEVYGKPKVFILHSFIIKKRRPINIPKSPKKADNINKIILKYLIENINELDEKSRPLITLIAITIIIIGETSPADTAASPNTNPPKIEMDAPAFDGVLVSLSLNISKHVIIKNASIKPGKGTFNLCDAKLVSNVIGIDSGL